VLFFLSLFPLEIISEIPVDIDQKGFFISFLLAVLLTVARDVRGSRCHGLRGRHLVETLEQE
jgi:hypothetical protein